MANVRGWSLHANHFLHKLSFHLHSEHVRKLLSPSPFFRRGNEGMKPLLNTGTCIWIKSDLTPECMLGTTHSTAYVPCAFQTALLVFAITSLNSTSPILSKKKLRPRELNCLAQGSLVAQTVKSACSAGDLGSIPGSGRSLGEGNGNPLQYSCLENPMDGGAW